MGREIKFRTWSKLYRQWCGGTNYIDGVWLGWICRYGKDIMTQDVILEQYTGLTDKNGKEIYEGDIVEIDKYGKFQIIWNEWSCKFDFDEIGKREREEPLLSQDWEEKSEIIGNIHENPELLEAR